MKSRATRLTLAAGLTLALGAAVLPLGCAAEEPPFTGVHSTPAVRDPRWLPEGVVEQLTACAEKLPAALPGERNEHLVGFDVQAGRSGAIDRVTLKRSTLSDQGVKACMGEVLSGMTLPIAELAPLLAAGGGKHLLSPEARGLLGGGPLMGSIALLPAVLTLARVVIVVAVVVYVSYEVVQAINAYSRSTTTTVAAAAPSATTMATAAVGAKAVAKPRRYPNQTCENEELDELEEAKNTSCNVKYPADCSKTRSKKMLGRIPCSAILESLRLRHICLKRRNLVQEKCFGGIPDDTHRNAIEETQNGIDNCEARTLINCAPGHPMAGL